MVTEKNLNNSQTHYVHTSTSTDSKVVDLAVHEFLNVYKARAGFFADPFLKKVKDKSRKALAELLRYPLPPTMMDLRQPFMQVLRLPIAEDYVFAMADGKRYTFAQLKVLVPQWALMAEQSLMESDPALADKLMSPIQWNAKSAFEVTFTTAMNEIKTIKKTKVASSLEHYTKWILSPLNKAIEQIKLARPPENALIGYGDKIPLREAIVIAESIEGEFKKLIK
ncbi:MAG TPA: hypothetical protein VGD65_01900 [Chryseosolibacter sp.]